MAEAVAKWRFKGNGEEFLTFNEGDLIKLTSLTVPIGDSKWYRAFLNGKHGYVAEHLISIKPISWFWGGGISRSDAEKMLETKSNCKFIIRETPKDSFQFYLTYKLHPKTVKNFKIFSTAEHLNFYFFRDFKQVKVFRSLNTLAAYVEHCGWYSAPFWSPFEENGDSIQIEKLKRREWSPNL